MKKIYGLMLLSLSLLVSCDNELVPFTPGSLTEDVAITKSSDLARLLNSGMNIMTNRAEYVFSSVFTDEAAMGFNNGGQGINQEYVFLLQPNDASATAIWESSYGAISRYNRVIQFSSTVVPTSAADTELINRSKAEALVLRAICHLKIMSYFSPDPKDNNALAGVLANRIIATSETPRRATNGEFYASIHADLDQALAIYATNTAPAYTTKTIYPSKALALAIKARAYALKGDYTNALSFADQVINTSGITLAATAADYTAVFHTHNEAAGKEVIFRLKRTTAQNSQATNLHNGWCSVTNRRNGSPFYEVSRSLYNLLAATPGDIRLGTNVYITNPATALSSLIDPNYSTAADVKNSDILVLQKHGGQSALTSANSFNPDFMVCRLSEMYFIRAEAKVAAGDLTGAGTALKAILDARFPTAQAAPVFANAQAAWKGILDERRKELSFEGFRFIDLKRLGTLAGATLDRDPADYASASWNIPGANPTNLPLTSYKWALPVPQSELNANGGIQQNTGY
jgi:tetratricopeptide (TPR) repeat protein